MTRPANARPGPGITSRYRPSRSSGSFHAGSPIPNITSLRRPSIPKYQTFPTPPPVSDADSDRFPSAIGSDASSVSSSHDHDETPLPVRQLLLLAFLSLAEQTALNSIGPYLPQMVASMPGIPADKSGLYVGLLASVFAMAQLSTNFLWGYASDVVGRKPVLLAGTFSLMGCFAAFGFCKRYWQMVLVHAAMGLLNGNAACVPSILGEITDRSNQSRAFTYLPIIYSLGGLTGPALGGILVGRMGTEFPYLGPNVLSAALLAAAVIVVGFWFEETLEDIDDDPWKPTWATRLSARISGFFSRTPRRQSWSSRWPRPRTTSQTQPLLSPVSDDAASDDNEAITDDEGRKPTGENHKDHTPWREILDCTTLILLATYLFFQLANISFNSLYPIFAAAPSPAGRELSPSKIGITLSFAGLITILFQAFLFQPLKSRFGNLGMYRFALFGLAVSMMAMPWIGYVDDKPLFGLGTGTMWLFIELGLVLILKTICAVGGLSSVMLLITNSAPSHDSLGTLNGVAQTLSALGRSIGPFASGGLFTVSMKIRPKGEALAWSIFGGLALLGCIGSLFIRRDGLESDDWYGGEEEEDEGNENADVERQRN
ncbi:major facilitator superfamily domain-containing protein [Trichoderma longibrachiatum]|uniref:MFS general substrate transporter n=1 Tax=Trichoderma longibrachiatum ATCC 18648 TaxID=983965 RepID=A0A2T4BTM9_TRILO|nr:MFS general substrate transporter [Trichoderma longibrachiatum ATCC 18648]